MCENAGDESLFLSINLILPMAAIIGALASLVGRRLRRVGD